MLWFLPHIAHAETAFEKASKSPAVSSLVNGVMNWIILPILEGFFLFTVLIFIWGVVGLIRHGDDPAGRATGQQHILWGVIGIVIMISAYGIIRVIANTIGVTDPLPR